MIKKGFDKLDNLVLSDCVEYLRDPQDSSIVTEKTRPLGTVVCKGTQICLLMPSVDMQVYYIYIYIYVCVCVYVCMCVCAITIYRYVVWI